MDVPGKRGVEDLLVFVATLNFFAFSFATLDGESGVTLRGKITLRTNLGRALLIPHARRTFSYTENRRGLKMAFWKRSILGRHLPLTLQVRRVF